MKRRTKKRTFLIKFKDGSSVEVKDAKVDRADISVQPTCVGPMGPCGYIVSCDQDFIIE